MAICQVEMYLLIYLEDDERDKLLKSIQLRAYKNEQKDTVVTMLRDRNSYPNQ